MNYRGLYFFLKNKTFVMWALVEKQNKMLVKFVKYVLNRCKLAYWMRKVNIAKMSIHFTIIRCLIQISVKKRCLRCEKNCSKGIEMY